MQRFAQTDSYTVAQVVILLTKIEIVGIGVRVVIFWGWFQFKKTKQKNRWKSKKKSGPMNETLVEKRTEEVLPTVVFEQN